MLLPHMKCRSKNNMGGMADTTNSVFINKKLQIKYEKNKKIDYAL